MARRRGDGSAAAAGRGPATQSEEEGALFKKTVREVLTPPLEPLAGVAVGCGLGAMVASVTAPIDGDVVAIFLGVALALMCANALGAVRSWWRPMLVGYPSAIVTYNLICLAAKDSMVAPLFEHFQFVDRVTYSTIIGASIGYGRDTTQTLSVDELLDFDIASPPPPPGRDKGNGES